MKFLMPAAVTLISVLSACSPNSTSNTKATSADDVSQSTIPYPVSATFGNGELDNDYHMFAEFTYSDGHIEEDFLGAAAFHIPNPRAQGYYIGNLLDLQVGFSDDVPTVEALHATSVG